MEKPILATTFSGLFVKKEPWDKAHIIWYQRASKQLKDSSVLEWIKKSNYFEGVDLVMKRLYPKLSDEERTTKAREMFFDSVLEYIEKHSKVVNREVINYFIGLKGKYRLALITTNTSSALERILSAVNLEGLFDVVETSLPYEKDNKRAVFKRFVKRYGKPVIYIGGSRKDSFDYCNENNIPCVFVNFEGEENINGVRTVKNLRELKRIVDSI
jgi:phosphoglycolate phosphatase-like HAD superfamily hydrolase